MIITKGFLARFVISAIIVLLLDKCYPANGDPPFRKPATQGPVFGGGEYYEGYSYVEIPYKGSNYLVFYKRGDGYETGYALAVVNLTKDSLEIAYFRKQLNSK